MRFALLLSLLVSPVAVAAPPYPPEPVPGSLVIVGGGKMPDEVRKEFVKLAGGEAAKLVVIPTASAAADEPKDAGSFTKPWTDAGVKAVSLLHTRDRKEADSDDFVKPLADATAVWFSGGDQSRITATYAGTKTESAFKKVLARGGVVGGTSAGAAVMSDLMITGGTDTATTGTGLGFLPGVVVDQHFTQRNRLKRLEGVVAKNPEYAGLGIDEGAAVILKQGRFLQIVGGKVTLCLAKGGGKPALTEATETGGRFAFDLYQLRRAAHFRAMKEPFPAAKAAVPEVKKGALVIVGGGGAGPEIWEKFVALAGGPDAKIVFVPTALEDPVPVNAGEVRALARYGAKDVKVLHTRDRKKADDPEFSKSLVDATGVWFSGGRHWRFIDSYEGTLTEKRLRAVLDRGGVIGGSSAGASIQSEYMPRGHPLGNTVVAAEGYERGFGYLPGCAVDQHFFARKRTGDMTGLMKQYPQLLGIGIDEATAIVVTGTTAEVIGKSKVAFFDYRTKPKADEKDYTEVKPGESYDLKARAKVEAKK